MPVNDNLGIRMKEFYEQVPKTRLMRRTPVAIRIDGKAFHTFTRGFQKPFDGVLMNAMQRTMQYLCENIQGCIFGYTQSDEITLILSDYKKLNSSAWFDYEVQKMCSISASMATMAFNRFFAEEVDNWGKNNLPDWADGGTNKEVDAELIRLSEIYCLAIRKGAMFDARVFNIPKEEVTNLVYWRQLDAARNSVQMVGQANFSHAQLQNKSCNMIQDMLMLEKGINWNNFTTDCKRGAACRKNTLICDGVDILKYPDEPENVWVIDRDMPMLKGENRWYLDELVYYTEEE